MKNPIIYTGTSRTIEAALLKDGTMPAMSFLESLAVSDQTKLYALFRKLGDTGHIKTREKFKNLEGDLWEFKSFQIRMPCFHQTGGRVVITHGFRKRRSKVRKAEIERAKHIRSDHLSREGSGR